MRLQNIIKLFICSLFLYKKTTACGISTHIEIGHMAASIYHDHGHEVNYRQLIAKHQDAYQAGNTYPDTYYGSVCYNGKYSSVSEDTHWTAFTNVTLQYIRDNFPLPWSQETEKLVVFMLGFVSHQVADITWHSLGIRQGFIRTMAAVDFHGVYDTAHSAADLGGDVVNEFRGDYSYISYDQWYIPVDHLTNIYKLYYGSSNTMPTEVIVDCTAIIFLAVLGERLALAEIYKQTAVKSPFLTQNLDAFFLGGTYDMSLWTTRIWDDVTYILENGFSDNCTTPENPLYIRCNKYDSNMPVTKEMTSRQPVKEPESLSKHNLKMSDITIEKTEYGVTLKAKPSALQLLKNRNKKYSTKSKIANREGANSPKTVISTKKPYSRLGHVIHSADINNDGLDDLIISAPMYLHSSSTNYEGAVFIIYGRENGLPRGDYSVEDIANVTLRGPKDSGGRFGSSVAVLDVNLDGYKDIVVSSPNTGWKNLTYTGGLAVWFGNKTGTFSDKPSMVHTNGNAPVYTNEGISLLAADVDQDGHQDLLVGSPFAPGPAGPQSGQVCVILSSKAFKFATWKCIVGPGVAANTSWFGGSKLVTDIPGTGPVLIVGAHFHRKCLLSTCEFHVNDTQSVGQVTIWSLPGLKLLHQMTGSAEHEHFGGGLSVGQPYGTDDTPVLAVGRHSLDVAGSMFKRDTHLSQAGAVSLYNLSTLLNASADQPHAVLYGDRMFSAFGSSIRFEDLNADGKDELLVGAPHFTNDPTELIYGAEQGLVFVFGGKDKGFPAGDIDDTTCADSWVRPCPSKVASRLLSWTENKAHLGGRIDVMQSSRKNLIVSQVVVSALKSSHGARQSGAVFIF